MVAYWVTFFGEAIRPLILFVAQRAAIAEILDKLRAGPRPREFYSPHSNAADFWAGSPHGWPSDP